MKILLKPNSINMIKNLENYYDGILLGVNNLAVNVPFTVSLEDLSHLIPYFKEKKKDIFIALNKNMHEEDLILLEQTMAFLESYQVTGICYYDIAVVSIKEEKRYQPPLVWAQEHLTTNYVTCNFWRQFGATFTLVSGEITVREILEIAKHTENQLLVPIFGYLPMFMSKRHLIKNYTEEFRLTTTNGIHFMKKQEKKYPIIDHECGTEVYSAEPLIGLREYLEFQNQQIAYGLIDSFLLEEDLMKQVLEIFKTVNSTNIEEKEMEIKALIPNGSPHFYHRETIYKVK